MPKKLKNEAENKQIIRSTTVISVRHNGKVVMAGDGQMDPSDLPGLLLPIVEGRVDYVKGNRFLHGEVWHKMPLPRLMGNVLLSLATKVSSGYWHLFDSQCGYTAASRLALEVVDAAGLFPRYGYPNDLLARLNAAGLRVEDAAVKKCETLGVHVANVVLDRSFQHEQGVALSIHPRNRISVAAHLLLNNLTRCLRNTGNTPAL